MKKLIIENVSVHWQHADICKLALKRDMLRVPTTWECIFDDLEKLGVLKKITEWKYKVISTSKAKFIIASYQYFQKEINNERSHTNQASGIHRHR